MIRFDLFLAFTLLSLLATATFCEQFANGTVQWFGFIRRQSEMRVTTALQRVTTRKRKQEGKSVKILRARAPAGRPKN